jgi:hypothetical protein
LARVFKIKMNTALRVEEVENVAPMAQEYTSLELLEEHGIAKPDIQKLRNAGFCSLESVAYSTKKAIG